jgi:hypothetical protein
MPLSVPFSGGCACGAIRYRCSSKPIFSCNCHCRECQHHTESAYAAEVGVPADAVELTEGTPTYYVVESDSGATLRRGFCGECGSPVLILTERGWTIISTGSLDLPETYEPQMDIFTSRAHPWDYMNPELPKFPEMLPIDGL